MSDEINKLERHLMDPMGYCAVLEELGGGAFFFRGAGGVQNATENLKTIDHKKLVVVKNIWASVNFKAAECLILALWIVFILCRIKLNLIQGMIDVI